MNKSVRLSRERHVGLVAGPDVSVIIPTYDRPDFLGDAVASVLAQTLQPLEILIVDNGSIAVDEGKLPQTATVHRMAPGVGPSRARNFGAALASGPYIAFLDDDDWWDPNFLMEARSVMASERVSCVYGRKMASCAGQMTPYKLAAPDELTVSTLLRRNPGTGGMNLLIERRLFLEIGGFDNRLLLSEDRALALEVLLRGERIATAPRAIAVVRHHSASRLRQRHVRKLSFVWKYRRLYSPVGFLLATGRILARSMVAALPSGRKK